MPVALTPVHEPAIPLIPPRKRWTRAECEQLVSAGIVDVEKLELIDGELITKMKNRRHVLALSRIKQWLVGTFGWDRVNQESPIDVAAADNLTNVPEPDAIVYIDVAAGLQPSSPQPADLVLVVEVADSTLRFELSVKASLYSRAGIAEYWVLDVNGRRLIVHRDPTRDGYRSIVAFGESEKVAPLASPESELLVAIFTA
jgi:Uma2 family endonuclease